MRGATSSKVLSNTIGKRHSWVNVRLDIVAAGAVGSATFLIAGTTWVAGKVVCCASGDVAQTSPASPNKRRARPAMIKFSTNCPSVRQIAAHARIGQKSFLLQH